MASISVVLICAVFSYVNIDVCGHVALTYPPARRYELDFLDNSRTKPPCGMPKGSIKTSFLAGSTFTVHWHLAYAHRGGYSLRILDYLERPLLDLTPRAGGSEFVRDDVTAQKFEVHLPSDFTCENCTLQLQREAGEWGANYRFWSCADIDILTRKDYHETCSGHGFHILGRCKCHKMYSGPRCQFSDECSEDNDCGLRGKCIDINATEAPSRMCYCPHGFYGKGCNKKAPWKDKNINLGLYSRRELSKFFNLYWRVLKENGEIEFVMMVNGTSYAGIGWRPNGLTKQCKNFPVLGPPMNENAITPKPEPLPEPEPKAEDEPSPEPNPEPSAEPNPEPSPEPNPEPSPEPNPEPTAEPTGVPEPVAEPSTAAKSTTESKVETATQSSENDNRNKRVAMHSLDGFDFKNLGNDVTVKTSVSYKVSSSKGRKKRAANETTNIDNLTHLSHDHSIDLTSESILEPNSEPESTPEPKSEPEPSSEPQSEPEPNSESALEPTSESEPSPEPKSNPEPSPEPKSDPESSPEPNTDPDPSPEPKSKQETMPHPKSEPEPKPTSKPKFKPKSRKLSDLSPIPTSEPTSRPKQYSTVKYVTELQPEPEPNPEPESEPEPSVEPNSTSELSFESKPEPSAESISHSEPKPISKPEPSPAPKYESVPTSEPSLKSVKVVPDPESYPEPESEPESSPEPKAEPEPSLEPNADLGPEKLLVKGLKEEAGYFPDHEYAPKFDFNPMDCTDIVIGTAKGNYHRVMDYYTRDRSTPRVDSFWGGHDDITAASGFEENGVTTIMFRRKIKAKEPTDHSLVDDVMHVIWARGQEPGNYVHNPPSGLERGAAAVGDFYRPDELKYHGHGAQRGVASINFFEETKISMAGGITPLADKCGGEFRFPTNCDLANSACDYYASWEYLGLKRGKDSVRFTIKTKHNKHWTGIGFSDNKKMSQTDAIIGWVDPRSGRPFLMDTWVSGYSAPRLDSTQDLSKASGSLIDGYTTLSFVRKRDTGDQKDLAFTDAQCLYMMFITQGGGFDPVNKRTSKHLQTPVVSDDRVCIRPCGPEPIVDENEMTIEPEVPGQRLYTMLVRITGLADSFKPPAPGSKDYEDLSRQVVDNFAAAMSKSKGYQGLVLNGFIQNETKAIIAELTLKSMESNTNEGSSGRSLDTTSNVTDPEAQTELWQQAVRETLAQGRVGNLNVDPDFLIFEPQSLVTSRPAETAAGNARSFFGQSESKLWVVVACVAALVLLALLQAACTIHRTSRQHLGKDQLIPNSAWKDYSAANTNYAFEPFENDDKYHSTSTAPPRHRPNTPARPTEPPPPRPSSGNKTMQKAHEANGTHRANGSHRANGTHESNGNYGANGTRGANSNHGWNMTHGSTGNGRMTPKHPNSAAQYYHETRSLQRPKGQYGYAGRGERSERGERGERGDRATYSLPRGARGDPAPGLTAQPDFYFMPSQRKYEGEVVRVFVDHKNRDADDV